MKLPFTTNDGCGHRARLGLIVLQSDETMEYELARWLGIEGVVLHVSRVPSALEVTPKTLAAMADHIPASAALMPKDPPFAAIAYGCTSGATIIGETRVEELVQGVVGPIPVTNPLTAVKAACRSLNVRKLGFVTPYVADVSSAMRTALMSDGIEVSGFGSFEEGIERRVARISEDAVLAAIETVAAMAPCDAVFASCTNLRSLGIIVEAERRIGRPVISSNAALAWHLQVLSGLDPAPELPTSQLFNKARKHL